MSVASPRDPRVSSFKILVLKFIKCHSDFFLLPEHVIVRLDYGYGLMLLVFCLHWVKTRALLMS